MRLTIKIDAIAEEKINGIGKVLNKTVEYKKKSKQKIMKITVSIRYHRRAPTEYKFLLAISNLKNINTKKLLIKLQPTIPVSINASPNPETAPRKPKTLKNTSLSWIHKLGVTEPYPKPKSLVLISIDINQS